MQQSELLLKSNIVLVVDHTIGQSCDQWRNVGSTLRWQLVIEPLGQRSATGRHSVCVWVPCFPPVWMPERNFQFVPIRQDSLLICGFAVRSCNPNFFCLALWNDRDDVDRAFRCIDRSLNQTKNQAQSKLVCDPDNLTCQSDLWLQEVRLVGLVVVVVHRHRGFVQIGLRKHPVVSRWLWQCNGCIICSSSICDQPKRLVVFSIDLSNCSFRKDMRDRQRVRERIVLNICQWQCHRRLLSIK